jgi:hypothetical protein
MPKGINNKPVAVDTPTKSLEYAYRAQEKLRLFHNFFVEWREDGKTLQEYNEIMPNRLKLLFPYEQFIVLATFMRFLKEEFTPRQSTISEEILQHRTSVLGRPDPDDEVANNVYSQAKTDMKNSSKWDDDIDLGEINKLKRTK